MALKILIIVRAGRESMHHLFSGACQDFADIAVSTFEDVDWSGPGVKYTHYARGGKFQGISDFLLNRPELIEMYDYFWCFEDDLEMQPDTLSAIHALLTRFRFMLAAPALTPDSHFSWTIAMRNDKLLFRGTNFVEVMAPIMSRTFLKAALPYFAENFTAFGYEWLWQRILDEHNSFAVIMDSLPIRHARPLGSGSLYKNRPGQGNIKEDFDEFLKKFSLDPGAKFRNKFAITAEVSPRLLTRDLMVQEMTGGYGGLFPENPAALSWCLQELFDRFRPTDTLQELRNLSGFSQIESAIETIQWPPVQSPANVPPNLPVARRRHKTAIVVCARWEQDYILEWVIYHKALGYDHIYLYCNDDTPDVMHNILLPFIAGPSPYITFHHLDVLGLQQQMYLHFLTTHADEVEWVSFLDVDEFLNLKRDGNIQTLLNRLGGQADCILFNWLVFGTNGHKTYPPGPVLENYTSRAPDVNDYTKHITKTARLADWKIFSTDFGFGFWHDPRAHLSTSITCVNVLGQEPQHRYAGTQEQAIIATATVHHYMVKSEEWLMHRVRRGTAGAFIAQTIWDPSDANRVESFIALTNQVHDPSLANFWATRRAEAAASTITYRPALPLISQNKPCNQSSICEWSTHQNRQEDAGGAVNGAIDGKGKFHTALELDPWWEIDLTAEFHIQAIAIYNIAFHTKDRFRNFRISTAINENDWHDIFVKIDNQEVGGLASRPFTLPLSPSIRARYLRITMIGENFLHLDQVEIFGLPA